MGAILGDRILNLVFVGSECDLLLTLRSGFLARQGSKLPWPEKDRIWAPPAVRAWDGSNVWRGRQNNGIAPCGGYPIILSMTNKKEHLFKPKRGQASTGIWTPNKKTFGQVRQVIEKVEDYGIIKTLKYWNIERRQRTSLLRRRITLRFSKIKYCSYVSVQKRV